MATTRAISVIWRTGKFRCELWAHGPDEQQGYQLKLFRDHELMRAEDVALLVYTQLAFSWKLDIEHAANAVH